MIRFEALEKNLVELNKRFLNALPFPYVILDDFADAARLSRALESVPSPVSGDINKSRDYMFAKNKFEKANFREFSADLNEIYEDLVSDRFQRILQKITGENVFVDKEFFGGGIHQGGEGSFLDMHTDFNYHPVNRSWFRNLNILLYLNKEWKPEYKGQLKLRHLQNGDAAEVEPLFNRCVIMFTRDYTLHGYDMINFPKGNYRRSIATYAYTLHEADRQGYRSTVWKPESGSALKKFIGANWPRLVNIKNSLFGIGTKNNR
jgi:hypothetical protein